MRLFSKLFNKHIDDGLTSQPEGFYMIRHKYGEQEANYLFERALRGETNEQVIIANTFSECGENILAFQWYKKAADAGNLDALHELIYFYKGVYEGIEKDKQKEEQAKTEALNQNYPKTILLVADEYYASDNLEKAFEYYLKAAELGNDEALAEVGICYLKGEGVKQNELKAFQFLSRSTDGKYGYYNLAQCYLKGIGTQIDVEKAVDYLEKAVEEKCLNLIEARKQLLALYQKGYGGTRADEKKKKLENEIAYEDNLIKDICNLM